MSNVESCRRCGRFFETHTGRRVAVVEHSTRRGWFCDTCADLVKSRRSRGLAVPALEDPEPCGAGFVHPGGFGTCVLPAGHGERHQA